MTRRTRERRFLAVFVVLASVIAGLVTVVAPSQPPSASAADASDFQPGYLISDANFFDAGAMSAGDIQSFLNAKLATCRPANGVPCLKDYSQATPARAADAYCSSFPGGQMSAAQLIAAVSKACGISPRVILVMLQKEQGLITEPTPSARQYSAALGQGCPDGAPCDPAFAGFFYQVYGAARQMQVYIKNPNWFGYQRGWNNILYQANPPDRSGVCGTKRVFIQNDATRALYIYTPYTPNDAALANLYGTGDFCSAYGNRNFWRLYTDWFGDPTVGQVTGEYATVWNSLGGSSGVLGSPTGTVVCINSRYCQQSFTGGTIFWFPGRGVFGVPSVVEAMWRNLGFIDGKPGLPTGVPVCVSDGTCAQSFDGGVISADGVGGSLVGLHIQYTWLAAGGVSLGGARGPEVCTSTGQCAQTFARGAFFSGGPATAVVGGVFAAWSASGMSGGALGYPAADAVCVSAGCTQQFGGGIIVASGANAQAIPTLLAQPYLAAGGVSALGAPLAPASCATSATCYQLFERARIDVIPSRGAIVTTGGFLDSWRALGFEQSGLGLPTANAKCSAVTCSQAFERGTLVGSPSNGVVAVNGQYRDVWTAAGGAAGALGLPLSGDSCNGRNCSQMFQRGALVWTPTYGMVTVGNPFLQAWQARGAGSGVLGAPTAAATCTAITCSQPFEGGTLVGSPSNGLVVVYGQYLTVWQAGGGGAGTLGLPLADDSCNGRNCSQPFQNGTLVWAPASGMVSVSGWFLQPWQAQGSGSGPLGAPTAAPTCSSVTCWQNFEGGVLSGSPSNGVVPLYGQYRDLWMTAGGPGGALGRVLGPTSCNGRWCEAKFDHGSILWSPATGAVVVAEPIYGRWLAAGGPSGRYGLPTAASRTVGAITTQDFQFGSINSGS